MIQGSSEVYRLDWLKCENYRKPSGRNPLTVFYVFTRIINNQTTGLGSIFARSAISGTLCSHSIAIR